MKDEDVYYLNAIGFVLFAEECIRIVPINQAKLLCC